MSHSVRRHLRVEIEAYDKTIRAFIPAYEEMLARAADAVAEAKPKKVIDLGAGTGALAQAVLQRCEGAKVELIDADAEMLDQARERLAPFAARVQYTVRAFQGPLPCLRRCSRLPRAAPRSHPSRKTDDLQRDSRRIAPGRRVRQRRCDHARRPVHSPSRIRDLGGPPRLLRHRRRARL